MNVLRALFGAALIDWAQAYVQRNSVRSTTHSWGGSGCWDWRGGTDGRYGHAYLAGSRIKAHVLSFLAFGGIIRRHHIVDHLCNRSICVNPHHLRACTQSDNMSRCFAEGRGKSPMMKGASNDNCC